ncbi:ArdC family protein [Legionella spiritensis]|uniref:ArdC family protein n=1 Tax=Legionella spiritensis TaxID=452 RepID=UPI000F6EF103|nr:zincin-like metallopeptidase domain-containing protein [Legionella spiritensis]VEG91175.1 DNA primase TraC [Legionella spiritensis]
MTTYQDFCTANAERLFHIINEHGSLLKWRQEWTGQGSTALPQGSNGFYNGSNLFALLFAQWKNGFKSSQWHTFNQIKKMDGQVLKGSRAEEVYFWSIKDLMDINKETGEAEKKRQVIFKTYRVFNLEQTTLFDSQSVETRQPQCAELLEVLQPAISHYGNNAYYNPTMDSIVLPWPEQFTNHAAYEATLLHELTHWTGHSSRLQRESMANYGTDKGRAEEELVAEIGAFFLTSFFNIESDIENHASYVNSWKQLLHEKEIMRATNMATRAFHFLVEPLQQAREQKAA